MNSDRILPAPWSRGLWLISVLGSGVMAGATGVVEMQPEVAGWIRVMFVLGVVATVFGCLLFTVRGYEIAAGTLLVRRLLWDTPIPLRGLQSVEADERGTSGAVRLCGNGGLFAFCGWFWNRRLGRFRLYGTDPRRAVVLRFREGVRVVTPACPEEFVRRLKAETGLKT